MLPRTVADRIVKRSKNKNQNDELLPIIQDLGEFLTFKRQKGETKPKAILMLLQINNFYDTIGASQSKRYIDEEAIIEN